MKAISTIGRILTGTLFLLSGILKAFDSASFAELIANYGLGWARHAAPVISGIEISLGLLIILNLLPGLSWKASFIVVSFFTLLFAYGYFFRDIDDCGCLGTAIYLPVWASFLRNFIILGISLCFIYKPAQESKTWKKTKISLTVILSSIGFCLAGSTLGEPLFYYQKMIRSREINLVEFERLYHSKIPDKGFALYFFYSPGCDHCRNATGNINSICSLPEFADFHGISFAGNDFTDYNRQLKPAFETEKISLEQFRKMVHRVPVLLVYRDGRLIRKFSSADIPCGAVLQEIVARTP